MTSPSRRARKPVESIRINARIEGASTELLSLKKKLDHANASGDVLQVSIEASELGEAIQQLRSLGDAIKAAQKNSERL